MENCFPSIAMPGMRGRRSIAARDRPLDNWRLECPADTRDTDFPGAILRSRRNLILPTRGHLRHLGQKSLPHRWSVARRLRPRRRRLPSRRNKIRRTQANEHSFATFLPRGSILISQSPGYRRPSRERPPAAERRTGSARDTENIETAPRVRGYRSYRARARDLRFAFPYATRNAQVSSLIGGISPTPGERRRFYAA